MGEGDPYPEPIQKSIVLLEDKLRPGEFLELDGLRIVRTDSPGRYEVKVDGRVITVFKPGKAIGTAALLKHLKRLKWAHYFAEGDFQKGAEEPPRGGIGFE